MILTPPQACVVASEEGLTAGLIVQASLVTKARFRRAQAMLLMANIEGGQEVSDSLSIARCLDEAQKELALVLSEEPGNEQALELAVRGLEISKRVVVESNPDADVKDEVGKLGSNGVERSGMNLAAAALGVPGLGRSGDGCVTGGGWAMSYMTPGWLEEQKKKEKEGEGGGQRSSPNKVQQVEVGGVISASVGAMVEGLRSNRDKVSGSASKSEP